MVMLVGSWIDEQKQVLEFVKLPLTMIMKAQKVLMMGMFYAGCLSASTVYWLIVKPKSKAKDSGM